MSSVLLVMTLICGGLAGGWITTQICGPYGRNSDPQTKTLALYASIVVFLVVQFITAKVFGAPTIYQVISKVFFE